MAPQGYLLVNGEPLGSERVNNVKNYVPVKREKKRYARGVRRMNISWWSVFIPNHILENGVLSEILQRRSFSARGCKNAVSRPRLGVLVNNRDSSFSCDSRNGFGKSDDVVLTLCNKGPAISVHPLLQQCKINIARWCFMNTRSLTMRIREGRSSYIWFTSFLRDGNCFIFF